MIIELQIGLKSSKSVSQQRGANESMHASPDMGNLSTPMVVRLFDHAPAASKNDAHFISG